MSGAFSPSAPSAGASVDFAAGEGLETLPESPLNRAFSAPAASLQMAKRRASSLYDVPPSAALGVIRTKHAACIEALKRRASSNKHMQEFLRSHINMLQQGKDTLSGSSTPKGPSRESSQSWQRALTEGHSILAMKDAEAAEGDTENLVRALARVQQEMAADVLEIRRDMAAQAERLAVVHEARRGCFRGRLTAVVLAFLLGLATAWLGLLWGSRLWQPVHVVGARHHHRHRHLRVRSGGGSAILRARRSGLGG